ncbi:MAG: UDP-N-acetylmuramate:L-alanyl-gamma-D-glutamyl-meso-diaminopimelate ligase [Magnetococcus sp. WYHC-3]
MKPHLHVIGICGTAMAGLAALSQDGGWRVTGSDQGIYPPMSDFLAARGIPVAEGFRAENLHPRPDLVLVGNAISRRNPELEALMDAGIPFRSGAQWLHEHLLEGRHPVVITGTHGKTTTSSLTAWLMQQAGWQPGFLIGGIPRNFGEGARYPGGPWVVVEGDEYDTAFFDKRPKFLHYHPRTLILHNLEYDHADIYPDLESIRRQFRLLLRIVPASGLILANGDDPEIRALTATAWSPVVTYGLEGEHPFSARMEQPDGRRWTLLRHGEALFSVSWELLGRHNISNALAAAAVALSHGMDPRQVHLGLESFQGVARRLELRGVYGGVSVHDDFGHHPTALATTLAGLRARMGIHGRIWAVLEPRSNTMRRRVHQERLPAALQQADALVLARPEDPRLPPEELLDVDLVTARWREMRGLDTAWVVRDAAEAVQRLQSGVQPGDHVVIMSNGGFGGIHKRLADALGHQDHGEDS